MSFKRIEIVHWKPKHTQHPVLPATFGVTNYDRKTGKYYLFIDIDKHFPLDFILKILHKEKLNIAMIHRTKKGYHIFTNYKGNMHKIRHKLAKLKKYGIVDRHFISLVSNNVKRFERREYIMLMRCGPKYVDPEGKRIIKDIKIIYVDPRYMDEYLREIFEFTCFINHVFRDRL